jgi:hypothetical protein
MGDLPMKKQVFTCDECGAERKEANHWFVAVPYSGGGFSLSAWPVNCMVDGCSHLCGQACVHTFTDRYMSDVLPKKAVTVRGVVAEVIA